MEALDDRRDAAITLRTARVFLVAAAGLYLGWWFVVEALLPRSFNPLGSRLAIVGAILLLWAATLVSGACARYAEALLAGAMVLVTLHYEYLLYGNGGDVTWWAGCVLLVACAGAVPLGPRSFGAYSAITLATTTALMVVERRLLGSIFLPSIATILLFSNIATRTRARLEQERRAAEKLRVERDRAQEASKLKGMFLGLVSHELVTPLQSITLNAERLRRADAGASQDERARTLDRIARGAGRLSELIESLLEYTRVEAGRLELRLEAVDLGAIAHEILDELSVQARSKGLETRVRAPSPPRLLRSDPRIVRLILSNLATNAIRHTDEGSVEIAVTADGDSVRVSVTDTGRGIPDEARETIFDAFTQLEPLQHKHARGIGLGLALVKQLTVALGARVELSSAVGVGTTFTIVFADAPAVA